MVSVDMSTQPQVDNQPFYPMPAAIFTPNSGKIPYCCPVCQGKGLVPKGFYNAYNLSSNTGEQENCRTCEGKGMILV